jgi:nucleotide-binding universal stress UspA family protein
MGLENLLLNIDHTKACAGRIDAAVTLAAEHGAHLTALYCIGEYHAPGWSTWPGHLPLEMMGLDDEHAQAATAAFTDKAEAAGISYETRTVRTAAEAIPDEVAMHARYTDLAIMGQLDPDEPSPGGYNLVEHVLLACGRPVLVVPYIGPPLRDGQPSFGRTIMVAWDAGREATRAVNDALPFLERAERVDLLTINPVKGAHLHGDDPGTDIALQLARHDVRVEVKQPDGGELDAGDILLARLADAGSDMLVMGGFAHSRLRELVLGGVTRNVLKHMPVPVLMSH